MVIDASALVELLLSTSLGLNVKARLRSAKSLHAPHLLDVEVAATIRRMNTKKGIGDYEAAAMLKDLLDFPVKRHPHGPFLPQVWKMRHRFTCYDACYLALAQGLGLPVLTCDAKLREAGPFVEVIE